MAKLFLCLAALSGFIAVAVGAFGAHGLKGKLTAQLFSAFQTGVQYHFYHTLALFGVALLLYKGSLHTAPLQRASANTLLVTSGWLYLAGILLFSGSLYLLALGGPKWLGPLTPIGGVCLLVAWALLLAHALRL